MSKDRKNSIKRYSVLLFIFIILSILFILPLFKWHYLPFGDDMDFNVDRVLELKYNFLHFNFYPQLSTYTFRSLAYPLNVFYPWYTLIPFAFFEMIIPNHMWGFVIGFAFYAFVGLTISYVVVKKITNNEVQSFFASVCYIFSEYLSIDAFRRFDLGEFVGMIIMPIAFYGFYDVLFKGENKKSWVILGLGMSLLVLTHMLSTLIVSMCLFVLFFIFFKKVENKKMVFLNLLKSILICIGASAIFLFPFIYQNIVQYFGTKTTTISQSFYPQGFGTLIMSSLNSECQNFQYGIGVCGILILILGLIYFKKLSNLSKVLYIAGSITFFMSSTVFPWYLLDNTIISIIQFPYRLLMLTSMFYAFVGGEIIAKAIANYTNDSQHSKMFISACFLIGLIVPQIGQTQLMLQNTDSFRNGYGELKKDTGVYKKFTSFQLETYTPQNEQGACSNVYDHVAIIDGNSTKLSTKNIKSEPNSIVYTSKLVKDSHDVVLPILYYKDMFKAERNGKAATVYCSENGQLAVKSSNLGPIKISYKYNFASILGIICSLVCWVLGLILLFGNNKLGRVKNEEE